MNINEGLKEASALKGRLAEIQRDVNRDTVIKTFESALFVPVKQPASIDPLIREYLDTASRLETLKQKIYEANAVSGAITFISQINYYKSIIPLLKQLSQVREEEVDMEGERFGKQGTLVRKSANFDVGSVKDTLKSIEGNLKQTITSLDKLNFTTEI